MVLAVLAPQDTQPAWVAGPEQSMQKMHPQLVIIIRLGLDCDEENMASLQLLQWTHERGELCCCRVEAIAIVTICLI